MPDADFRLRNRGATSQYWSGLRSKLVAYWKMEEASGTRFDSSGNGNNLTSTNNVGQATGKVGNCASFVTASSQRLSRSDQASLRLGGGSFSFALWFQVTNTAVVQTLIAKDSEAAPNREWRLIYNAGLAFNVYNAAGTAHEADPGTVTNNTWHFVVCWYNAVLATMNAQLDNGTIDTVGIPAFTIAQGTAPLTIGCSSGGGADRFLGGLVDEVLIANQVWSAAERAFLYNNGFGRTLQ